MKIAILVAATVLLGSLIGAFAYRQIEQRTQAGSNSDPGYQKCRRMLAAGNEEMTRAVVAFQKYERNKELAIRAALQGCAADEDNVRD